MGNVNPRKGLGTYWAARRAAHTSKKLNSVKQDLLILRRAAHTKTLDDRNEDRFIGYVWDKFDPSKVIEVLSSSEEGFYFQKKILFQALCAWVVAPNDQSLVQTSVSLSAGHGLVVAEERSRKHSPEDRAVADILTRLGVGAFSVDPEFFDEIYYPIGGLRAVRAAPERAAYYRDMRRRSKNVEEIIRLADVFHYHVEILMPSGKVRRPSISSGAGFLFQLDHYPDGISPDEGIEQKRLVKNKRPKERTVQNLWVQFRESISLLHAAYHVEFAPGVSLLHAITSGRATYSAVKSKGLVSEWFGRARFFSDQVLSKCAFSASDGYKPLQFGMIEAVTFPAPTLSGKDQAEIERRYSKDRLPATVITGG